MTEKQYGGASSHGFKGKSLESVATLPKKSIESKTTTNSSDEENSTELSNESIEKYKKAGKIAVQTIAYIKPLIKSAMPLLEIAEKIEAKIQELGGKPAFPTNLSIDEYAAHCTPSYNDESKATGLLKVDLGVHIEGYIADTSFSIDLDNSE